ncbi:MAG: mRNA surveillance protein pelota [archaeon]
MRILRLSAVEKRIVVECHSSEDFPFVASLIREGDLVYGETDRAIKPKEAGQKAFRLPMTLLIKVNSTEVDESTPSLRVSGSIEEGSPAEFVELHAHHSLVFGLYTPISITKKEWLSHEIEKLKQYEKESQKPLYFSVVLDDEEAHLIQVSGSGLKEVGLINAQRSGKQFKSEGSEEKYFSKLSEIIFASPLPTIILAGPGFTRESLVKYLLERNPKTNPKQFLSVPTTNTGEKGIREALSSQSIAKALGESRLVKENALMQEVLMHLGKDDGLCAYGFSHVERSVKAGAAYVVLLSSQFDRLSREKSSALQEYCHQSGIQVFILDVVHDPGKQLEGLSGIASLLRYRFE